MPCAKQVLPAPSSPCSRMTSPGLSRRARRSPRRLCFRRAFGFVSQHQALVRWSQPPLGRGISRPDFVDDRNAGSVVVDDLADYRQWRVVATATALARHRALPGSAPRWQAWVRSAAARSPRRRSAPGPAPGPGTRFARPALVGTREASMRIETPLAAAMWPRSCTSPSLTSMAQRRPARTASCPRTTRGCGRSCAMRSCLLGLMLERIAAGQQTHARRGIAEVAADGHEVAFAGRIAGEDLDAAHMASSRPNPTTLR